MSIAVDWDDYSFALRQAEELPPVGPVISEDWFDPNCTACEYDHHSCAYCNDVVGHGHLHDDVEEGTS